MSIPKDEFKKIVEEEGCNLSRVARRCGFTPQYASAHLKEVGLKIEKVVVDSTKKAGYRVRRFTQRST